MTTTKDVSMEPTVRSLNDDLVCIIGIISQAIYQEKIHNIYWFTLLILECVAFLVHLLYLYCK